MKKDMLKNFILVIALLASRLLLISHSTDFFDATQYIRRVQEPFWNSLTSGHPPFHPLYIAFGNIFYKILAFMGLNDTVLAANLPSAIFGALAIIVFYFFVKDIFNRKIALLAASFTAIMPFIWIASLTILVDPTGLFFFLLAVYLYWLGLKNNHNKKKIIFITTGGLSFGLALFAHTSFAMWTPIFLGLFIYKEIKDGFQLKDLLLSLLFIVGPILAIIAYVALLVKSNLYATKILALEYLLLGNIGDKTPFDIFGVIRTLWEESTFIIMILSFLGFLTMLWQKKKELILIALWIAPSFLVASYVYENLHGRAMIMALFALAILSSYFIYCLKIRWLRIVLIIISFALILNVSLPIVLLYAKQIAPNETLVKFEQDLEPNSLFIGTNVMRTWSDDKLVGKYERLGDVDVGTSTVLADIKKYLSENKQVYLSSDAIFLPYWRYDGENFDIRSLAIEKNGFAIPPLSSEFFDDYKFDLALSSTQFKKYVLKLTQETSIAKRVATSLDNAPREQSLFLGRLVDAENGSPIARSIVYLYSNSSNIVKENILSRDLFYQLYRYIINKKDPQIWGLSDNQGIFILPSNQIIKNEKIKSFNDPSTTRLKNDGFFFLKKEEIDLSKNNYREENNLTQKELLEKISNLSEKSSFCLKKNKNQANFDLITFDYVPPKTNIIEAENLSKLTGENVSDSNASGKMVRQSIMGPDAGYLTTGPYLTLSPGQYQLKTRLKIDNVNQDKSNYGIIEIAGNYGGAVLANKDLNKNNFEKFKEYSDLLIDFGVDKETSGIEFRTIASGHANLYVDFFELKKID